MSNYSESDEGSLQNDFNPEFKTGNQVYQSKSPLKGQTVKVMHSKLKEKEEESVEQEESEDSEFAEDEDLCDEEEMYMRKKKKELKQKQKASKSPKKPAKSKSKPEPEEDEDLVEEGEESEEEIESEESVPLEPRELPKRDTRGKRMNLLVGKALEEDEEFWGGDLFQEADDDESFDASSGEAKDSFDSDFDKSEHSEGEGEAAAAENEIRKNERKKKKQVKFAVPAKKKPKPAKKKPKVEEKKGEEDKSSNASEPIQTAKRSKRLAEKREEESEDSASEVSEMKRKKVDPKKTAERKREIKEKNKAFLEQHGIFGDVQEKWSELLSKDKLTPTEKIQEAALTEIINKESLSYLQELENERVNEMVYRDRRPKGPSVKLIQDIKPGHFNSRMVFPSSDWSDSLAKPVRDILSTNSYYPKNFNTKKERRKGGYMGKAYQMNTCMITGKKAKYKDPLTLTPFANKDAFKVVRERFFQKEEDKINMRIHIINELLNQKRDKLKRYQSFDRNLEISQEMRDTILNNAQKVANPQYK